MSGIEIAGLVFATVGTIDICFKYGKLLIDSCSSFDNAENEIKERVLCVKSHWKRTSIQIDFIQQIWDTLDEDHQNIQSQILQVLISKLTVAITKLDKLAKKPSEKRTDGAQKVEVKRWKYVLVKQCLDETIKNLESWQKMFDPSWFLIMKVSNSLIDQELARNGSAVSTFPGALDIRDAVTEHSTQKKSIFLPAEGIDLQAAYKIPFATAKIAKRVGSAKWLLVDSVMCDPEANSDSQTRDVRELARKLSCSDPIAFGILQCRGVVRIVEVGSRRPSSFEFIFRIPEQLDETPTSLRACLLSQRLHSLSYRVQLAKQLAKSVSYVHTLGFVHKNVRPDTVIIFDDKKSTIGSAFLTGFENVRMADGRTYLSGDSAWEKNLYRHPQRQGLTPEESYVMQHDIYSLGVCLLEIGLWESFISYNNDGSNATPGLILRSAASNLELSQPVIMQRHLIALAVDELPKRLGDMYRDVVVNCLTCLDEDNADFGDQNEFEDVDGVLVGVRYIEKILLRLDEIML
ncbi:hypothetical protein BGZ60DRAFT_405976 [Tricladium varicosporioides]|nr:hypothetical protein BGZ60DRAFT_405976 [Hymenoscyphus varicosporioides]